MSKDKVTFIMVVGLPCSGKTHLGKKLLKDRNSSLLVDDPKNFEDVSTHIKSDDIDNIIITDLNLCIKKNREIACTRLTSVSDKAVYFEWIYFENKPEKCFVNYTYRKSLGDVRKVSNSIVLYSKLYEIPEHSTIIEIWQPTDEELNEKEEE